MSQGKGPIHARLASSHRIPLSQVPVAPCHNRFTGRRRALLELSTAFFFLGCGLACPAAFASAVVSVASWQGSNALSGTPPTSSHPQDNNSYHLDHSKRTNELHATRELCAERPTAAKPKTEQIEAENQRELERVLRLMNEKLDWEHVTTRQGIRVDRKFMPAKNGRRSKFCCVRTSGIVDASVAEVAELFEGNTRVAEYNRFYAEGRDLEYLTDATKVVWTCSPPLFMFKPRDYCTIVDYKQAADGTVTILNRGTTHPAAPVSDRYVRAEILLAASIIQPCTDNDRRCRFTSIAHINPGGLVPAFLVNKLCARGPIELHQLIEKAAQRTRFMGADERKAARTSGAGKYAAMPMEADDD